MQEARALASLLNNPAEAAATPAEVVTWEREGFHVALALMRRTNEPDSVRFATLVDDGAVPEVRKALAQSSARLRSVKVWPGAIDVDDNGALTYPFPTATTRVLDEHAQRPAIDAILDVVASVSAPPPPRCRCCGIEAAPRLVDGRAERLCSSCEVVLADKARRERAALDAIPARLGRAVVVAGAAAAAGAVLWAIGAVVTGKQHHLAALVLGLLIAWLTRRAAGKETGAVRAISIVAATLSPVSGMLLLFGLLLLVEQGAALAFDDAVALAYATCAGFLGGVGGVVLSRHLDKPTRKR